VPATPGSEAAPPLKLLSSSHPVPASLERPFPVGVGDDAGSGGVWLDEVSRQNPEFGAG